MKSGDFGNTLSEINVTPLVDVMLVLLIIFMITAPLLQEGISLQLPKAKGKPVELDLAQNIIVSVDQNYVYMNNKPVALQNLLERLKAYNERYPGQSIYLRGDERALYGRIIKIIDQIREAGIENLSLITQPVEKSPSDFKIE